MSVTIVKTIADQWWLAQIPQVRSLRGKDASTQSQGAQILINRGLVSPDQASNYLEVFKYGGTPDFVWTPDEISAMPRAADLVLNQPPFSPVFPNCRGNPSPGVGDFWEEQPGESSPIGSYATAQITNPDGSQITGEFEKFQCNSSASANPFYYSDWSLDFGDRTERGWVRTK